MSQNRHAKVTKSHFSLEGYSETEGLTVKLLEMNISKLEALAKVAEQIGADIIIEPGMVILRKRPK